MHSEERKDIKTNAGIEAKKKENVQVSQWWAWWTQSCDEHDDPGPICPCWTVALSVDLAQPIAPIFQPLRDWSEFARGESTTSSLSSKLWDLLLRRSLNPNSNLFSFPQSEISPAKFLTPIQGKRKIGWFIVLGRFRRTMFRVFLHGLCFKPF